MALGSIVWLAKAFIICVSLSPRVEGLKVERNKLVHTACIIIIIIIIIDIIMAMQH